VCLTSQELNWSALEQKLISAPFTPSLANQMDISNFPEEFTAMNPADSYATAPSSTKSTFRVSTNVCPTLLVMLKDSF
jgi:hypothetical protein